MITGTQKLFDILPICSCKLREWLQVWSSSQSPESVMKGVAQVLGLPQSRCTVRCRRMGGAFGGKTTRSVVPATAVAVAANKLGRQVCTTHLSNNVPVFLVVK